MVCSSSCLATIWHGGRYQMWLGYCILFFFFFPPFTWCTKWCL